ncbi:MAG: cyanophycinase [Xanthomonadales bacterium]|nr:cyanophycinase [Xanthomonadales bacterium]
MRPTFAVLLIVLVSCACAAMPVAAQDRADLPRLRHFVIGDTAAKTPGRVSPGLLLMGGSEWTEAAFDWFASHAGNGHLVILRASGGEDLQKRWFERFGGVASVQTFVFGAREAAGDAVMLAAVAKADGVFIAGGDQSRYIRYWKDTPLESALDAHVKNRKPLGGTSAGLAILGHVAYGALDGTSMTSARALADPLGDGVTLDEGFLAMPFLGSVVTDTHFARRDRLGRLIVFLARARHDGLIDEPLGIGVDESTVLCVEGDGRARVIGANGGRVWFLQLPRREAALRAGTPLDLAGVRIRVADEGSRIRLRPLSIRKPAFEAVATIRAGVMTVEPPLPPLPPLPPPPNRESR